MGWTAKNFASIIWLVLVVVPVLLYVFQDLFIRVEGREPDWRGPLKKRFRLSTFKMEWGRECFITEWDGEIIEQWWEWEE